MQNGEAKYATRQYLGPLGGRSARDLRPGKCSPPDRERYACELTLGAVLLSLLLTFADLGRATAARAMPLTLTAELPD
eukprot:11264873-Alexandrium_andersonii.AAC.1